MEKKKKSGALISSIVCLVLGCGFMVISLWSVVLYAPLLFAAFVLSIVAMAQNNTMGGILVLVGTIVLPSIIFGLMFAIGLNEMGANEELESLSITEEVTPKETNNELDYKQHIELYDFEAKHYKDYLEREKTGVRFKLKNNGDSTLSYIKVVVYFKNAGGDTIYEDDMIPFNTNSMFEPDKPLRPNYIWQLDDNMFLTVEGVPDEWQEGNAEVEIIDIDF